MNYETMVRKCATLLGNDARTRMQIAELLSSMCMLKSVPQVAKDTGLQPWHVRRYVAVYDFWGGRLVSGEVGFKGARQQVGWGRYEALAVGRQGWRTEAVRVQLRELALTEGARKWLDEESRLDREWNIQQRAKASKVVHTPEYSAAVLFQMATFNLGSACQELDQLESLSEDHVERLRKLWLALNDHVERLGVK